MNEFIILGDDLSNTVDLEIYPLGQDEDLRPYALEIQAMSNVSMQTIELGLMQIPKRLIVRLNPKEIYSITLVMNRANYPRTNLAPKRTIHLRIDHLILLNIASKLL